MPVKVRLPKRSIWLAIVFAAAVLSIGCDKNFSTQNQKPSDEPAEPDARQIFRTNLSEELILNLTPKLAAIARNFEDNSTEFQSVFCPEIEYLGPKANELDWNSEVAGNPDHVATHLAWPIEDERRPTSEFSQVWSPVLGELELVESKFGVLSGEFLDDNQRFKMSTTFEARAKSDQPIVAGIKAKQTLVWEEVAPRDWKIRSWVQESLGLVLARDSLFKNVTKKAFPDPELYESVSRSKHEEFLIKRGRNPRIMNHLRTTARFFVDWNSLHTYPSASVIDLDQDGWDDIFLTDRTSKCLVLRNRGDGTFEDVTESTGLKLDRAVTNCALFADFDNDGDSDLLLGRSSESSLYFENRKGKFVPDEQVNKQLEYARFVTAGSVVDINHDGLLDVYLSTYVSGELRQTDWVSYVVPPDLKQKFIDTLVQSHPFVDRAGPPNLVLMNRAGKLELTELSSPLSQWRNSFQSVWSDFDKDGDLDVYLCNDFAPDVLMTNETEQGSFDVKFTDRTEEFFPGTTMGYGMGASLGDYDSNGEIDIYVSNMYSKAGKRVIASFQGKVDPRIKISSQGNFLYRREGNSFRQVAGLENGQQHVSKVGWSFGGQFADFDNDQRLDLYVPSGFFTAPEPIAQEVDL